MLITALEKEKQQIYQKGKIEREIEVAKAMLSEGMDLALIFKITALSQDRLLQLKEELSSEGTLHQ